MVEIRSILQDLIKEQNKLKEVNKTVKEIKSKINEKKDMAKSFMDERNSNVLEFGSHEVAVKIKMKKPTLNKANQEAWARDFFQANDLDPELAPKLVQFFQAKITEGSTETEFISITKLKTSSKKRKKKEEPEAAAEPAKKAKEEGSEAVDKAEEAEIDMLFDE